MEKKLKNIFSAQESPLLTGNYLGRKELNMVNVTNESTEIKWLYFTIKV